MLGGAGILRPQWYSKTKKAAGKPYTDGFFQCQLQMKMKGLAIL
jgi:hypothetical protein